jgi:L-lactate dehydrogenase complex protein LldG
MNAREEILHRVRAAKDGATRGGASSAYVAHTAWSTLSREYKRKGTLDHEAMLNLFEDRLHDYDAHVTRTARTHLAQAITTRLAERNRKRIVIPDGLAASTLPDTLSAGFDFVIDEDLSAAALDTFDGVLTQSTTAIAETGTIILHNLPGQGRRALTLVPDYHLCLVREQDVVETVPEAMARIAKLAGAAATFVSGPSATADIEMTRIKGVHGPRHLDVFLISE